MSGAAFAGVACFVAVFTVAGVGLLVALRGPPRAGEVVRDLGLAYMLGLAGLGSVLTLEVIVGIPLSLASILVSAAVVAAGGVAAGVRRERPPPPPAARPGSRLEVLLTGALVLTTVVVLEAVFRSARLQGLYSWDAGSFWVPKAESLYYTGGLDLRHIKALPAPSYPPFLPVVHATFFELRGGVDIVALHLLHWTFLVGFVGAAVRLLSPLSRLSLVWAAVLFVVVTRGVGIVPPGPDVLMDCLLGLTVVCLVGWLSGRAVRLYPFALVFLSGAVLTKREALLAAACIVVATAVATIGRWRAVWPRLALLAIVPVVVPLPWRAWFMYHGLPSDGPELGPIGLLHHLDRAWPSLTLVLSTLPDPVPWRSVVAVAVMAVAASLLVGERKASVFTLTLLVVSTLAFAWVMWSFPSLPLTKVGALNPIPRLVGAALVPAGLLVAVLLDAAVTRLDLVPSREASPRLRRGVVAAVVVVALGYPASVLAVEGMPRFPSRADCARLAAPPTDGGFLAVYAHTTSFAEATDIRDSLLAEGFVGAEARPDGCGAWEVANPTVQTLEQARGHAEDARRAGYTLRLERP
jgi:hypothetical protein